MKKLLTTVIPLLAINLIAFWIWGETGIGCALILSGIILYFIGKEKCVESQHTYISKYDYLRDYYNFPYLNNSSPKIYSYRDWQEFAFGAFILVLGLCIGGLGVCLIIDYNNYIKIKLSPHLEQCDKYLSNKYYLPHFHKESVQEKMDSLLENSSLKSLYEYCSDSIYISEYKKSTAKKVQLVCEKEYQKAVTENTMGAWIYYRDNIARYHKSNHISLDSIDSIIQSLEKTGFDSESSAWKNAVSLNNTWAYNKYLSHHPNGAHEKEAVDALVSIISSGEHGDLPRMEKVSYGNGSTSSIYITNDTGYHLTLLYSGVESRHLILPPNGVSTITLRNGVYKIAASVDVSNVQNYAGEDYLGGGSYSASFYIITREEYGR